MNCAVNRKNTIVKQVRSFIEYALKNYLLQTNLIRFMMNFH